MAPKTPWRDFQDRRAWMAALPPEVRQAYQRRNFRWQMALVVALIVAGIAAAILHSPIPLPIAMLVAIAGIIAQKRDEKRLGLK